MEIHKIIPYLYASDQIGADDWDEIADLEPGLIVGVGADAKDGVTKYHDALFIEWHIKDEPILPSKKILKRIAHFAAKFIDKGQTVLVHDRSGNNRVYLMVAQILTELDDDDPYSTIHSADSGRSVLSNKVFADYVEGL